MQWLLLYSRESTARHKAWRVDQTLGNNPVQVERNDNRGISDKRADAGHYLPLRIPFSLPGRGAVHADAGPVDLGVLTHRLQQFADYPLEILFYHQSAGVAGPCRISWHDLDIAMRGKDIEGAGGGSIGIAQSLDNFPAAPNIIIFVARFCRIEAADLVLKDGNQNALHEIFPPAWGV